MITAQHVLVDILGIPETDSEALQSFLDNIQKEAYDSGYENGFEDGENEAWANNYDVEGKYE